jgi:hypothetical protein
MRITPTGSVGIGTTNPLALLDVCVLASGARRLLVNYADSIVTIKSANDSNNGENLRLVGDNIIFNGGSSGNGSERMRITTDGNVGIGTNSPNRRLVVNSGIDGISAGIAGSTYGIRFDNGGSFSSGMSTIHGVDSTLVGSYQPIMLNGSDVRFATSATERMRITSAGSVCINTTTADAQGLSINPSSTGVSIYLTNPSTNSGTEFVILNNTTAGSHTTANMQFRRTGTVKGSITNDNSTTSFNTTSDYRLKEDFKNFDALSIIDSIKVYDFKWKIEDKRMHGVIAHEVAEVLPYTTFGEKDAVNEEGEIRPQQVDYAKFTPVLLKAIQEQQALITDLRTEIEELKARI